MAAKPYFFYGHRRPSQNRPTVHGGLFSNRQTLKPPKPSNDQTQQCDLSKWDPNLVQSQAQSQNTSQHFRHNPKSLAFLSPIARFIADAFRKNQYRWGPPVVAELQKLRRVTPSLVAEVLKVQTDHALATKFFHWAGRQKGFKHDFGSYNAFAYCLNRAHRFRDADQVPELMEAQGKPPSEKQFEILIRMHADANRGLRVYYVYGKMKKFGVKPRLFLYNRVMDALVKTGYLNLAMSVYEDFKEDGLAEESVTFMILIKGLCKEGRVAETLELLEKMRATLCKPDVFAYTAMVKSMVREGNVDGAIRVWEEMKRDGVCPDVVAYGTMITGLCRKGEVEKAQEFFKEMKGKRILIDRAIYGALVEAFVAAGKVGTACDLTKDMVESGYKADLSIYGFLIRGLCDVSRVDRAHKLFQATVKEGLGPDFQAVTPILLCYSETGSMDKFHELLIQMEKSGISILDGLSKFFSALVEKKERVAMAVDVFSNLKTRGYYNVEICNVLMQALHGIGMGTKVLSLFDDMKNMNVQPDSSTYSVVIECLVEDERVKEACAFHNKIIEMSLVPSASAYLALARALCGIGEIDEAMMLVRDCLGSVSNGPMEFKHALTILHVCKSGSGSEVIEALNEMMRDGCRLDDVMNSAIISGMCKHGTIEEARKVFSHLRERKILSEAKTIVYEEMLIDHMKKAAADLVVSGIRFFGLENKLRAKGSTLLPPKSTVS